MKIIVLVMGAILFFSVVVGIVVGTFNWIEGDALYEDQAYKQLVSVTESKANRLEYFLDNRKADAIFLSESEDVKKIFREDIGEEIYSSIPAINLIAGNVAGEVEEYLISHPDMSIEELREDEEFRSISIQPVGETGYTDIIDIKTGVQLFHKYKEFEGFDPFSEENMRLFPDIAELSEKLMEKEDAGTFYRWKDPDGVERDKYAYYKKIEVAGYEWHVGATAYLQEYGELAEIGELSFELRKFQESKGYSDMMLINPEGDVIWTAHFDSEVGSNLVTGPHNESLLADVFDEVKGKSEVEISDSEVYGPEGKLNIFVTAPVMTSGDNGEELLGIIVLELENHVVEDLIETDVGLGELGEVYIINRGNMHITTLKHDTHEESQSGHEESIISERVEACFEDYNNYQFSQSGKNVEKTGAYDNYAGVSVLGAHKYILGSEWCIIAEMNRDEFLEVTPRLNRATIITMGSSIILFFIISLFLDSLFKIKRGNKNEI